MEHIPAKADVNNQATLKENILEPLIKSAQNGEYHLFFMHASHFISDNARYQHCEIVKNAAAQLGIQLDFLPPYSPNLNLIERLWKFVKKKTLYGQFTKQIKNFMLLSIRLDY